jgi:hypothetical protein
MRPFPDLLCITHKVCVQDYLENSTLLGQPQAQEPTEIYSKTSLIRSDRDQKIGLWITWFRIIQFFYSGLAYRVFRW